jgi:hypothetical protein
MNEVKAQRWYVYPEGAGKGEGKDLYDFGLRLTSCGTDEDPQELLDSWDELSNDNLIIVLCTHDGSGWLRATDKLNPTVS